MSEEQNYFNEVKERLEEAKKKIMKPATNAQGMIELKHIKNELKSTGLTVDDFVSGMSTPLDFVKQSNNPEAVEILENREKLGQYFKDSSFIQVLKSANELVEEMKSTPIKEKTEEHEKIRKQMEVIAEDLRRMGQEIEVEASRPGNQFNAMAKKGGNVVDFIAFGNYGEVVEAYMGKIDTATQTWEADKEVFSKKSQKFQIDVKEKIEKQKSRKTGKMKL